MKMHPDNDAVLKNSFRALANLAYFKYTCLALVEYDDDLSLPVGVRLDSKGRMVPRYVRIAPHPYPTPNPTQLSPPYG